VRRPVRIALNNCACVDSAQDLRGLGLQHSTHPSRTTPGKRIK